MHIYTAFHALGNHSFSHLKNNSNLLPNRNSLGSKINIVDVLHVRLTELPAAQQNLPFPPIEPSL